MYLYSKENDCMTIDELESPDNNLWYILSDESDSTFGYVFEYNSLSLETYYHLCYDIYYDESFQIRCYDCNEDYTISVIPPVQGYYFHIDGYCYDNVCPKGYF